MTNATQEWLRTTLNSLRVQAANLVANGHGGDLFPGEPPGVPRHVFDRAYEIYEGHSRYVSVVGVPLGRNTQSSLAAYNYLYLWGRSQYGALVDAWAVGDTPRYVQSGHIPPSVAPAFTAPATAAVTAAVRGQTASSRAGALTAGVLFVGLLVAGLITVLVIRTRKAKP